MRKIMKKIVAAFTIIGAYLLGFANKIHALTPNDIASLYGPEKPKYDIKYKIINGIFLILLPISAIITIIAGTRKYIKNSTDSKIVKILISIIAVIVIVILIGVLVLGINNLFK
ncbi:MAG: hypothetical protein V8R51_00590 [Clostridia bacterium]